MRDLVLGCILLFLGAIAGGVAVYSNINASTARAEAEAMKASMDGFAKSVDQWATGMTQKVDALEKKK